MFFKSSQNLQDVSECLSRDTPRLRQGCHRQRYFSVNFAKLLRIPLLKNTFGRLSLLGLLTIAGTSTKAFKVSFFPLRMIYQSVETNGFTVIVILDHKKVGYVKVIRYTEAVARMCSTKKLFLKI